MSKSQFLESGKVGTNPIGINSKGESVHLKDLSESVGGSIYGTTPGGSRIKYDRKDLMNLRMSPYSKTPPVNLPIIPGVTKKSFEEESPVIRLSKEAFTIEDKDDVKDDKEHGDHMEEEPIFKME
jgi:hypothetical protein